MIDGLLQYAEKDTVPGVSVERDGYTYGELNALYFQEMERRIAAGENREEDWYPDSNRSRMTIDPVSGLPVTVAEEQYPLYHNMQPDIIGEGTRSPVSTEVNPFYPASRIGIVPGAYGERYGVPKTGYSIDDPDPYKTGTYSVPSGVEGDKGFMVQPVMARGNKPLYSQDNVWELENSRNPY